MRTTTIVLSALAAVTLAACGGTGGSVSPTVTVTETVTAGAESSSEASTPTDEPSSDTTPDGAQAKFGQTYTYTDGLAVTVSAPKPYKPSQYAACDKAKSYIAFTITLKNGTGKVFDPSLFHETVQSGQTEGDSCFDSQQGLGGGPDTKLLAGRTVTWKVGFGIADPKDIVMEVTPSFDYDSAIFTN